MLTKRNFYCPDFYKFCIKEFETSRQYLKSCGKPTTDEDKWWIFYHKETASIFGKYVKDN